MVYLRANIKSPEIQGLFRKPFEKISSFLYITWLVILFVTLASMLLMYPGETCRSTYIFWVDGVVGGGASIWAVMALCLTEATHELYTADDGTTVTTDEVWDSEDPPLVDPVTGADMGIQARRVETV